MTYRIIASGADEDEWFAARRTGVTATDVARLASGGAAVIEAIKAEKADMGRRFETRATRHGHEREPIIAAYAEEAFGFAHSAAVLAAADRREHLATPDLLGMNTVGEIKTTVHDWQSIDEVPKRYIDQAQWQMRVTDSSRCFLIFEPHEGFVPIYPDPKHFIIPRDDDRIAELKRIADDFWSSDAEPDPDAAELEALLNAYADAEEMAAPMLRRRDEARAAIEDYLHGQPRKFPGSRVLLTRSADGTRRTFQPTKLRDDHPDLYDAYTIDAPVKGRLTISLRGEHD